MISLLQGKIVNNSGAEVVVMTSGGVGYKLMVSPSAAQICSVGKEVTLEVFLSVKEGALDLFGFAGSAERELFKHFLMVSGIGPKTALHLLSLGSVEEITLAIGRGDVDYLTKVSGIGKKTAERIVVELKSKVAKDMREAGVSIQSDALGDVIDGLVTLGYSVLQARDAAKQLDPTRKTSEQLLREALRIIK